RARDPAGRQPRLSAKRHVTEILDVFGLASFCQNARCRSRHSAAAASCCDRNQSPVSCLTRRAQSTTPGDRGITKPKARKHWLEPCARRSATKGGQTGGATGRRAGRGTQAPSSHFANSGSTCASQEHFSWGDHFFHPRPECSYIVRPGQEEDGQECPCRSERARRPQPSTASASSARSRRAASSS